MNQQPVTYLLNSLVMGTLLPLARPLSAIHELGLSEKEMGKNKCTGGHLGSVFRSVGWTSRIQTSRRFKGELINVFDHLLLFSQN